MKLAKIAVLAEKAVIEQKWQYGINSFQLYVGEILANAGISFDLIDNVDELEGGVYDIALVVAARETEEVAGRLWAFAEAGGTVIGYTGLSKLAGRLGCVRGSDTGVGYAALQTPWANEPIRYLQASPWHIVNAPDGMSGIGELKDGTPDGQSVGHVILSFNVGKGAIHRWAVDPATTVVLFQQGSGPVLDDGVPAKDGTGAVDEGILKADDRCVMDWELDRQRTETGITYYGKPYADFWRGALIGQLLAEAVERKLVVPFLGSWPEGVEQVAMISFDSDMNIDEAADKTLELLNECGVTSTWCIIEPGFSPEVYPKVLASGNELALHYNALEKEDGVWAEEAFKRQYAWVKQATGQSIASNKNHYTRIEGWGELFKWCEDCGIQSDESRGPSKKGNIGFLFGTCQPYYPIAWFDEQNRYYDVLEIGFLTQDLNHHALADDSVIRPFLEGVAKVEGVAHFLFHQVHILQQASVRDAFRRLVAEARARGFQFWNGEQVNRWVRSRRQVRITGVTADGDVFAEGTLPQEGVVCWIPVSEADKRSGDSVKYGIRCRKAVVRPAGAVLEQAKRG